jgi:glycosyltransferase involved in cell wall biosynthesis
MLVSFIDESIPYDGHSPNSQPLGGGEKALAGLAAALARAGHTVRVFNRCAFPIVIDGVSWQPLDDCRAAQSDWLIVHKDPRMLGRIADAERRALLLSGSAEALGDVRLEALVKDFEPTLIFFGKAHSCSLPAALQLMASVSLELGVSEFYRKAAPMAPVNPPRALVTTHPGRGLDWLLDIWCEKIFSEIPWAELHIYSTVLERGALGATIPERLVPVFNKARAAEAQGVRLKRPLGDAEMIDAYRQARVHLYPGSERDMLCSTLAETQSVGLPCVARPLGATKERMRDGESGYLAEDGDAFAAAAKALLLDTDIFNSFSEQARASQVNGNWDHAVSQLTQVMV